MSETKIQYIRPLDGVRGVAVLLVLWAHLPRAPLGDFLKELSILIQPAYSGVDLFFVLSGFLITRILLATRRADGAIGNFVIRRALRIFPAYYIVIAVLAFYDPGDYIIWSAFYVSNFVFSWDFSPNPLRHTWSLSVEEHFYLVWPLVVLTGSVVRTKWLAIVFACVAVIGAIAMVVYPPAGIESAAAIYRWTPFRMLSLLAGVLIAIYEPEIGQNSRAMRSLPVALCVGAVALVSYAKFGFAMEGVSPQSGKWLPVAKLIGFCMLSSGVVIYVLRNADTRWVRVCLSGPFLGYIGQISYGLYLYHFPIYYYAGFRSPSETVDLIQISSVLALVFGISALSNRFIESPIRKFGNRYR